MQLIDKLILEQKKEIGEINYIEDYELLFWKESAFITKNNEEVIKKVIRRDKISYPEEKHVKKIIETNKSPILTFNDFSILCFNRYNRHEALKPHELNHLQKYVDVGTLILKEDTLIKTTDWEYRESLLNREKNNQKGLLSEEINQVKKQLESFYYLEEKQIIQLIYRGNTELFLSDSKALKRIRSIEKTEIIRGKLHLKKNGHLHNKLKDSKKVQIESLNASHVIAFFEYDSQQICEYSEMDQKLISRLTDLAKNKGFLEKITLYKKKNKKKINVTEFNHDRYIYDAYCHAKQMIENNGGLIKKVMNEQIQKQEIYTGRMEVERLRHPDLLIFYEDRLGNEQKLNLEVAINYKPIYIAEKASQFKNMNWYCIDRTQYKTIQENVPSGHEVYLLPRRW